MRFHLITLFPALFDALKHSIVGRAIADKIIELNFWNPRDFTNDPHRTVDDRPYGGGPGMVMRVEPLREAIKAARKQAPNAPRIYLSPQGEPFTQKIAQELALQPELILLAGRYEGIDQRVIDHDIDREISIGDYILSGGEIPATVMIDAITRLLPNSLGHPESANNDSYNNGLLDHPCYTRPEIIDGQSVPDVLLSGNHTAITRWRLKESLGKTWQKRPDLIKRRVLNEQEKALLDELERGKNDC